VPQAANKFEERRAQYRELSFGLGAKLGEDGADLAQCVHHIVWVGGHDDGSTSSLLLFVVVAFEYALETRV
jgi:hypothetical protein